MSLTSCVQEFDSDLEFAKAQLFVHAELDTDNSLAITLSQTTNFGQVTTLENPEDAYVIVNNGEYSIRAEYDFVEKKYMDRQYEIIEGVEYSMDITVPQSEFEDVTAKTTVPEFHAYKSCDIKPLNDYSQYSLNIEYDESVDDVNVHLIVYYFIDQLENNNGAIDTIKGTERIYPELVDNVNVDILNLEQRQGILYNVNDLNNDILSVTMQSEQDLLPTEIVSEVFVESRIVDKAYYNYHCGLTKQLLLDQNQLGEPVIDQSNIHNGFGLFGSYTSKIDKIKF